MNKFELLDSLLKKNNGFIKTSDATNAGVSRAYFGEYAKERALERAAHGLYMSSDAWDDGMYVIQVRYPLVAFSHETAAYLLGLADREPIEYSVTLKAGTNATGLTKQGIRVHKIQEALFGEGLTEAQSPAGHTIRTYNAERTICDLFRNRSRIEVQDLQTAIKEYARRKDKNIPLLMRYAKKFSVEKPIRQYLDAIL